MPLQYDLAIGLNKGFKVTPKPKRDKAKRKQLSKRPKFARELIREVSGYAPYEKRLMELLKLSKEKRAYKFAKRRLGTHRKGLKKRDAMSSIILKQRQAAQAAKKATA